MDERDRVDKVIRTLSDFFEADIEIEIKLTDECRISAFVQNKIINISRYTVKTVSESVLAFILVHEFVHDYRGHIETSVSEIAGILNNIGETWGEKKRGSAWKSGSTLVQGFFGSLLYFEKRKIHEYEADFLAIIVIAIAGYSTDEIISFMRNHGGGGGWFSNHPDGRQRVKFLSEIVKIYHKISQG